MKKVIFLNDSMVLAGTEVLLLQLVNHLQSKEIMNVTLLLPYPSTDNVLLEQVDKGVCVTYIHQCEPTGWRKKWNEIQMIFNPKKFRKSKDIDTTQYDCCVAFKEGFYANVFAGIEQVSILWIHNILYKRQYKIRSMQERLAIMLNKKEIVNTYKHYRLFDQIVCVSSACQKAFQDVLSIREDTNLKIKVLPNGVNMQRIAHLSLEGNPDFDNAYLNFVLVTRNSVDKQPSRVLEVAKYLKENGVTNIKIHVVGICGEESFIQNCNYWEEVKDFIIFYGSLTNPYPYIKHADWSLCVSERESFSLSVLESLVLETPVLSTACGGPEDILDNGRLGMIVENSFLGIAQAMEQIAKEPDISSVYRAEMKKGLERYSLNNWLLQSEKLIDS